MKSKCVFDSVGMDLGIRDKALVEPTKNIVMNMEEDIEKRSVWTNVALFMVGIAILAFIPKLKQQNPNPSTSRTRNNLQI